MVINWGTMLTIFLAIILASLAEHMVIAPRMAHSPPNTVASISLVPMTAAELAELMFPDAVTL